jgi:hypothetical protein
VLFQVYRGEPAVADLRYWDALDAGGSRHKAITGFTYFEGRAGTAIGSKAAQQRRSTANRSEYC